MSLQRLDHHLVIDNTVPDLDAGRPPVHAAGAEERDLAEADALAQRNEHDAVPGPPDHLHRPARHDKHFHSNVAFLSKYLPLSFLTISNYWWLFQIRTCSVSEDTWVEMWL